MVKIKFTSALTRFFPDLREMEVQGNTVKDVIKEVENAYPGMSDYILSEDGSLRKHVNIFIDEDLIHDRTNLSDIVEEENEILIYQALSGG